MANIDSKLPQTPINIIFVFLENENKTYIVHTCPLAFKFNCFLQTTLIKLNVFHYYNTYTKIMNLIIRYRSHTFFFNMMELKSSLLWTASFPCFLAYSKENPSLKKTYW